MKLPRVLTSQILLAKLLRARLTCYELLPLLGQSSRLRVSNPGDLGLQILDAAVRCVQLLTQTGKDLRQALPCRACL